ncbi:MAG: hypothetical protein ACLPWS_20020 [Rhodomicrobium sp.]
MGAVIGAADGGTGMVAAAVAAIGTALMPGMAPVIAARMLGTSATEPSRKRMPEGRESGPCQGYVANGGRQVRGRRYGDTIGYRQTLYRQPSLFHNAVLDSPGAAESAVLL